MATWYGMGVHLANQEWPEEAVYRGVEIIQPRLVSLFGYHQRPVYDRIETICAPIYLCRIGNGRMDKIGLLNDYQRARREVPEQILADGRWMPRCLNEPNCIPESYADEPEVYAEQFCWLAARIPEPLGLANLTLGTVAAGDPVTMDWPAYLARLVAAGAVEAAGWVALSLYGDMADPARLTAYLGLGKPLLAVEFNVPWYHGEDRVKWWQWRASQLKANGINGLCVYILGGETGDQWPETYILNDKEVEGLAGLVRFLGPDNHMSTDYGPAIWKPSPNFGYPGDTHGRQGHRIVAIVNHITAGSAEAATAWFLNPASSVSAHYLVARDGVVTQFVLDADAAWQCGVDFTKGYAAYNSDLSKAWIADCWRDSVNPNKVTLGIEHEALAGQGLTEVQTVATIALQRHLCAKYNIPPTPVWVVGHSALDAVNRGQDPGPAYPWARIYAALAPPPPAPDYERYRAALDHLWDRGNVLEQVAGQIKGDVIDLKRLAGFSD